MGNLQIRMSLDDRDDLLDDLPDELTIQLNLRKAPAITFHNRKLKELPDPKP